MRRDPILPIPPPPWEPPLFLPVAVARGFVRLRLNTGDLIWLHGGARRDPIGRYVPGVGIEGEVPADRLAAWAQSCALSLCHPWDNAIAEAALDPVDDDEARAARRHPWRATHALHWMGEPPGGGDQVMAVHDEAVPDLWHLWAAENWTRGDEWTWMCWDGRLPPSKRLRIWAGERKGMTITRLPNHGAT